MKKFLLVLISFYLIAINLNGQESRVSAADSLRNLGSFYYDTKPEMCISLHRAASVLYAKSGDKKQEAFCMQNIAFTFHEKLNNTDSAIYYMEKAIALWTELEEPLNRANLLKLYGMLQGKNGKYTEGITSLHEAIKIFEEKNFKAGIAVSYFDMALLFDSQKQIDSCIYYLKKNKAYFETVQDTFRIFGANNVLFEKYTSAGQLNLATNIYEDNLKMENSGQIHWQQLINFYKTSLDYSLQVNNQALYDKFLGKYKHLHDSLTNKGIQIQ